MTARRLPPEAAEQFVSLGFVQSREVADMRIARARRAGATKAECAEALATWEQMRAQDVQHIQSQPTPAATCLCSHGHPLHVYGSGKCVQVACGCRHWRSKPSVRRLMDAEAYDPSPAPINRSIQ